MTFKEKCEALDKILQMLGASECDAHTLACKIANAIDH